MRRVLLAEPRGFCAGVDRAVTAVVRALELYGPPVYVRKHVVHNAHVVVDLEAQGAVFVESELAVPRGARLVLAAHGVEPGVYRRSEHRELTIIDSTCPLVQKVHAEVRRFAATGHAVLLIGHAGHDEVIGTLGQAPEAVTLVESVEQAHTVWPQEAPRLAYVTQTTLSVDETSEIIGVLRERFPGIVGPGKDDICYATTNRQAAVKKMLGVVDVLLVVGSVESSNSNRLVETARAGGIPARLIEDAGELDADALASYEILGVTAGASTPERLVAGVCDWFRAHGVTDIGTVGDEPREDVVFRLPAGVSPAPGSSRSDDADPLLRTG